jgi:hypothetical protein
MKVVAAHNLRSSRVDVVVAEELSSSPSKVIAGGGSSWLSTKVVVAVGMSLWAGCEEEVVAAEELSWLSMGVVAADVSSFGVVGVWSGWFIDGVPPATSQHGR